VESGSGDRSGSRRGVASFGWETQGWLGRCCQKSVHSIWSPSLLDSIRDKSCSMFCCWTWSDFCRFLMVCWRVLTVRESWTIWGPTSP